VKIYKNLVLIMTAIACWSLGSLKAEADQVLYDGIGFFQGTQSFSDSFSVSTPGILTVTLGDIAWPAPLASLNLLVSSPNGALGPEMGIGTQTFDVNSGNISAQWFGSAAPGGMNAGVYSLEIQFSPNAGGSPVPLPTSILLLASGLAILLWQRRSKIANEVPPALETGCGQHS
jgi:hypothetical protein